MARPYIQAVSNFFLTDLNSDIKYHNRSLMRCVKANKMSFAEMISIHLWQGKNKQTNSVALVRKPTIPIERPPLVGEVNANFSG
jgi:hypothetical protein